MSRLELAEEMREDFDRILDHLAESQPDHPELRIREIISAINVLVHNQLIGRRSHCYVALYRYLPEIDTVFVLAIRSQREAGYWTQG